MIRKGFFRTTAAALTICLTFSACGNSGAVLGESVIPPEVEEGTSAVADTSPVTTAAPVTSATSVSTQETTTVLTTTTPAPAWRETEVEMRLYVNTDCYSREEAVIGAAEVDIHYINEELEIVAETDTGYCKLADGTYVHSDYLSEEKLEFESNLNVIRIDAPDIGLTDTENYVSASVTIEGTEIESAAAKIRGRGHSTWKWDKKPYKIKFEDKQSVLGMHESTEWVLLANYADESLIRNYVAHEMSKALDGIRYAFSQVPVIVYINGEYQGIYTIGEQIEVKEGRVDLVKDKEAVETSFLIEVGGKNSDEYDIDTYTSGFLKDYVIKYPKEQNLNDAQVGYITDYLDRVNAAVVSGEGYEEYIDVNSFIDWLIIQELSYNLDSSMRRSCYLYKDAQGKLCMGPIWDFDLAFGNFTLDNQEYNDWVTLGINENDMLDRNALEKLNPDKCIADIEDNYIIVNWFNFLLTDEAFVSQLKARWAEKKQTVYYAALNAVDNGQAMIGYDYLDEYGLWEERGVRRGYQSFTASIIDTYAGHVYYLRNFIATRYEWLDKAVNEL